MKVIIIGAGIGGLCAARALQGLGMQVVVYEMTTVLKPVGAGIGLAANAVRGLDKLGLATAVIQKGKRLTALQMLDKKGRMISDQDTSLLNPYYGNTNLVIHRAELHELLLGYIKEGTLMLGKRFAKMEQNSDKVKVIFTDGSTDEADLLIAADGIHSAVRLQILPHSTPRYAGYTCWRAVIADRGFDFNREVSAESWAPEGRFGMAALPGERIYWYCCVNAAKGDEGMRTMTPEQLAYRFRNIHHPIPEVLAATKTEQLIWNDIIDIRPLKQFVFGRVVLLGDAAHATTPNMGQGACQAIEDAVVLADCLRRVGWAEALAQYERRRMERTARIIQLSRLLGQVSQWEQAWLCSLRNNCLRALPQWYIKKQMKWLFDVDF